MKHFVVIRQFQNEVEIHGVFDSFNTAVDCVVNNVNAFQKQWRDMVRETFRIEVWNNNKLEKIIKDEPISIYFSTANSFWSRIMRWIIKRI